MTVQNEIIGDFFVGEKLGPYGGNFATVLSVSDTELTVFIAGKEVTTSFA